MSPERHRMSNKKDTTSHSHENVSGEKRHEKKEAHTKEEISEAPKSNVNRMSVEEGADNPYVYVRESYAVTWKVPKDMASEFVKLGAKASRDDFVRGG